MSRIFISYRRDDSLGHVGWLRSLLIQRFGADEIFRDIETIPPGVDFVEAIEAAVGSCEVLLAVIGPRWLTTTDRQGQRRLDNPEDFVRIEIATALERKIRVIPVLVQDAPMPRSNDLPADIAKLARRNAIDLRDSTMTEDVGRLGDALESILQSQSQANQVVQPSTEQKGQTDQSAPPIAQKAVPFAQGDAFINRVAQSASPTVQPSNQTPQSSQEVDVLLTRLLSAEEQKDWNTAIVVGERALKLDPNHELVRSKTAFAYYQRALNRHYGRWFSNWGLGTNPYKKPAAARKDYERAAQLGNEEAKKKLSTW